MYVCHMITKTTARINKKSCGTVKSNNSSVKSIIGYGENYTFTKIDSKKICWHMVFHESSLDLMAQTKNWINYELTLYVVPTD